MGRVSQVGGVTHDPGWVWGTPGRGGSFSSQRSSSREGLKDTWFNLSEWAPLLMYEVSCEGILLFERILRASWEAGCLSCRIREDKGPDLMGTQIMMQQRGWRVWGMEDREGKQVKVGGREVMQIVSEKN